MTRRVRSLAALLALVGFTALLAESLAAAACLPMAAGEVAADGTHGSMHHGAPAEADPPADDPAPPLSQCPQGMIAGGTCSVAATLPPVADAVDVSPSVHEDGAVFARSALDLLAVHTLFHPPRS